MSIMKRPAVFFDRDNTLLACDGYLGDPSLVVLIDGAADAIARARQLGYATVVVSNQSGVARGMYDEAAVHAVNARLDELLEEQNPAAIIDRHEFCPYHPEGSVQQYRVDSDRRKPKPGMILCAADKLALDLPRSWVIGDTPRDVEAGRAAGCRTILFRSPDVTASPAAAEASDARPDATVTTLREAIDFIESHRPPAAAEELEPRGSREGESILLPTTPQPNEQRLDAAPSPGAQPPHPAPPNAARPAASAARSSARLEHIAQQILDELKRRHEQPASDFSVTKLLAGIVQVLVLAVLFLAYLNRNTAAVGISLLLALVLQTMTIALLIMQRQK
jgi:D-glycero-D-manno-heptose 1,7-bisphosphate phosphatase